MATRIAVLSLYVNKLTITKKSNSSLWITSKVTITNNKLYPKCYTCNIVAYTMKNPNAPVSYTNNLNPLALCR